MEEVELTVRIYIHGEYENSCSFYVNIPKSREKDDEMSLLMKELQPEIEGEYGYYEEWESGDISWKLVEYKFLN